MREPLARHTCTGACVPAGGWARWHLKVKSSPHSFEPAGGGAACAFAPKCTPTRPSYAPTQKPAPSPRSNLQVQR